MEDISFQARTDPFLPPEGRFFLRAQKKTDKMSVRTLVTPSFAEVYQKIEALEAEIRKHNLRCQDLSIQVRAKDDEFCAGLASFGNVASQLIKLDSDFDEWSVLHEELIEESELRWKKLIELRKLYYNTNPPGGPNWDTEQKSKVFFKF